MRAADKVVFSAAPQEVSSARTRIERGFDPETIRRLKTQAQRDFSLSGPHLAAQAFQAGLVDERHLFLAPVVVGAGKRALPKDLRRKFELLTVQRFAGGMVYLQYRLSGNLALLNLA